MNRIITVGVIALAILLGIFFANLTAVHVTTTMPEQLINCHPPYSLEYCKSQEYKATLQHVSQPEVVSEFQNVRQPIQGSDTKLQGN